MRLAELSWSDVESTDAECVLIPVGSTEQHGPHAPLGTDTITAEAIAEAGADAYDGTVIITPPIPVGVAEEHRAFAGTMWVHPDTFRAYINDCVTSLAAHGFETIVLVNGHGGNTAALREVSDRVTRDESATVVPFTWFDAVNTDVPLGHGGARETALLQYCRPDLVHEDRLEEARSDSADHWGEWVGSVNLAHDVDSFTENGVVGDPCDGSAELGEALLAEAADELASVLAVLGE